MTLDEYIEALRKQSKCDLANCSNFDCNNCEFSMSLEEMLTNEEILSYFEELKATRTALRMACDTISWAGTGSTVYSQKYYDDYLREARANND